MTVKSLFLAAALSTSAADTQVSTVTVDVTNIDAMRGTLIVVLYDNKADFDGGEPLQLSKVPVSEQQHKLTFDKLVPGTYAVKLFHDENDNGKLDTNFLGIPSEGYGFSNNGGAFGPSSFADAAFSVAADTKINIKLR